MGLCISKALSFKERRTVTVAQLIEKLKEMPQDMEVYDWNYYPVEAPIVKKIELWATGPVVDEKTVVMLP